MAFTIAGKIEELKAENCCDNSIGRKYHIRSTEYEKSKDIYKTHKNAYKDTHSKLIGAEEKLSQISRFKLSQIFERRKVKQVVKNLKNELKIKEASIAKAKLAYKDKHKKLKEIRSEVRQQYKNYKAHEKFAELLQKADKQGIELPRYIEQACNNYNEAFDTTCYQDVNRCYKSGFLPIQI